MVVIGGNENSQFFESFSLERVKPFNSFRKNFPLRRRWLFLSTYRKFAMLDCLVQLVSTCCGVSASPQCHTFYENISMFESKETK